MKANSGTLLTKRLAPQWGKIEENYSVDQPQNQSVHTSGLVRRIKAKITALKRFLKGLRAVEKINRTHFTPLKLKLEQSKTWQHLEDFSESGLNKNEYGDLENSVQHHLIKLATMADKQQKTICNAQPLRESQQHSKLQLVELSSTQLTLTVTSLQRTEAENIYVFTGAHNGRISSLLLSPHQLKDELTLIKAHVPTLHALAMGDDNLIEPYKLISAKEPVTKSDVIFEIKLPTVDRQPFIVFRAVSVPTVQNETLITITSESTRMSPSAKSAYSAASWIPLNQQNK
uniref:Uncharacterized protein n=1 Tax=Glossina pallidipes TaxID=7398 RepID=A0A1A9ZYQ1_GLOPL